MKFKFYILGYQQTTWSAINLQKVDYWCSGGRMLGDSFVQMLSGRRLVQHSQSVPQQRIINETEKLSQ